MQSSAERKRLLKIFDDEPINARMVLAKCAAGLVVIVLIAVIGLSGQTDHATPGTDDMTGAAPAAQAHRKQVFDERRARFDGAAGQHSIASEAVEPSNQLPLALR